MKKVERRWGEFMWATTDVSPATCPTAILKIVKGTCDWDESLQQRPQSL